MLKKVSRLAAILAAVALIFGAVSCSDGSSGNNDNGNTGGSDPLTGGGTSGGTDDDGTLSGWWSLDEYISSLNIPSSTTDLSANTAVGPVTILAPAKWTSDGKFSIEGTERAGYVQLAIPDAGTEGKKKGLQFTVPAGATKIVVYGKNDENLALIKAGDAAGVPTENKDATSQYGAFTWDITATEDTVYTVYHNKEGNKSTINIKAIYVEIPDVVLESIAVTAQPTKTEYAIGGELDTTGLEVTATYSNGKTKVVTASSTISDFDSSSEGKKTLTVTYKEGEVTETATFEVTVKNKSLSSIAVKTNPTKVAYKTGDELDLAGLVITLTYDDSSTEDIAYKTANATDFSTTGFNSSAAATDQEVTVTYKEKTAIFKVSIEESAAFTKFDAAELYGDATGDVNIDADKDAEDGSWKVVIASKKKAQVKKGDFKTYDYSADTGAGYNWTNRFSFNKQGADNVKLMLKVGAGKEVILRVDGGSVKDAPNSGITNLTFTGAGDAVKWEPYVSCCTTYVTVTGDTDGYVTITSSDTTNGANIYGITVVEALPETLPSAVELENGIRTSAVYNKPVIAAGYTASVTQGETFTATATVAEPTKSTLTHVYADGTLGNKETGTESVDGDTVVWTTTVDDEVITLGTGLNLSFASSATESDENYVPARNYSVTASYTIGEGEDAETYTSDPITIQVKEASATYVTVTFDVNGGTLAEGASNPTQDVESNVATALTAFANLGITAPAGKTFAGWATSNDGEKTYDDGADVTLTEATTLYAVYNAASVYTITFDNITETVVDSSADSNSTEFKTASAFSYTVYGKADGKSATKVGNSQNYVTEAGGTKISGKCINFGGAASFTSSIKSCIEFTAPSSATSVTVQFYQGNSGRKVNLYNGKETISGIVETAGKVTDSANGSTPLLTSETFTITGGSTIRIGSASSGIYILGITIQ